MIDLTQAADTPGTGDDAKASGSMEAADEIVINLMHQDTSPWDTDQGGEDSDASTTSTPACKRGKHEDPKEKALTQQAADMILAEGFPFPIAGWMRNRGCSIQVLADARIKQWPKDSDNIFTVDYHDEWRLVDWICGLRAEEVRIIHPTVILYFECAGVYAEMPPLKNALETVELSSNINQVLVSMSPIYCLD